jgi:uncharacterized membrane protein
MKNIEWHKLRRLWRHLSTTTLAARRAFPHPTLQAIQSAIGAGETAHRAEVRVIVEAALSPGLVWRNGSARERAVELFGKYRIWDTEENCGLLLYVNMADHKVEIVPDRGVNLAVSKQEWHSVCRTMTDGFAAGSYHDSILAALAELNALLARHYPHVEGQHNELSDKPILL